MGLLKSMLLGGVLAGASAAVSASNLDWELDLDARAVLADAEQSFLHGGLGKLRYDNGSSLQLGRVRLGLDAHLSESLRAVLDASAWGDHGPHPLDLTEAFMEYRPYPHNAWRLRLRAGAFYPPSSLANRANGWQSPYTISSSALDSWLGEEIRAIGIEAAVDHLGSQSGGGVDWGVFASVFGWNDPAGVLMANHGFALHDRQTRLHDHIGPIGDHPVSNRQLFYEIDGRPGYYAGGKIRVSDHFEARALHYDNRADPTAEKPTIDDYAWRTEFDTASLRVETQREQTLLVQWMRGKTAVQPSGFSLRWQFDTWSLLANQRWGAHSLSLRYDDFNLRQVYNAFGPDLQRDRGFAWTLAYAFEREGSPWRFMAELLRVDSFATDRVDLLQLPANAVESKLELSLRYRLSGKGFSSNGFSGRALQR